MAMATRPVSPPDSETSTRKRIGKACDRCRMKKSKCDGSTPCSRCKVDNAICVFGERKRAHDKIYPKGYVEMLEQQQTQLVNGLQKAYERLLRRDGWIGPALELAANGQPLIHRVLERLDALRLDTPLLLDRFEEDTERLQQKLIDGGDVRSKRRSSPDSNCSDDGTVKEDTPPPKTPTAPEAPIAHPSASKSGVQLQPVRPIVTSTNNWTPSTTPHGNPDSVPLQTMPLEQPQPRWRPQPCNVYDQALYLPSFPGDDYLLTPQSVDDNLAPMQNKFDYGLMEPNFYSYSS